jgi:hypothetical protein
MVGKHAAKPVCWSAVSIPNAELTLMYAVLLALLLAGGVAIYAAYRWYRTLKQPTPTSSEEVADLADLARALQEQGELDAAEAEKIRAAVERQRTKQ